jgi:hypothetical protein
LSNTHTFVLDTLDRIIKTSFIHASEMRVPLGNSLPGIEPAQKNAFGWRTFTLTSHAGWHPVYWSRDLVLWEPGVQLFEWLEVLKPGPTIERGVCLFIATVLLLSPFTGFPDRRERNLVAVLFLSLIAYVISANVVLAVRPVEAAAVWPLACLLWAVGLGWMAAALRRKLSSRQQSSRAGLHPVSETR